MFPGQFLQLDCWFGEFHNRMSGVVVGELLLTVHHVNLKQALDQ